MIISIYCSSHFNNTRWFTAVGSHFRINDVDGMCSGSEFRQFKINFHKQTSQAATCQIQTFTLKLTLFFWWWWWCIRFVYCLPSWKQQNDHSPFLTKECDLILSVWTEITLWMNWRHINSNQIIMKALKALAPLWVICRTLEQLLPTGKDRAALCCHLTTIQWDIRYIYLIEPKYSKGAGVKQSETSGETWWKLKLMRF